MKISAAPCYLIDGQGMEVLLRRRHPGLAGRQGALWKSVYEEALATIAAPVELCLFGLAEGHEAAAFSQGEALRLRLADLPLADFAQWVKRDARKRREPCWYCLVSEETELRRQARELGLAVLEPAGLLRRLGLDRARGQAAERPRPARREPSMLKGGKTMSETELAWWLRQLELPAAEASPEGKDAPAPDSRQEAGDYARLMGTSSQDPRILDHDDETWLEETFPPGDKPEKGPETGPPPRGRR